MIEITGYENIGKGKYRTNFDNGTTCVLYRTEAVRYSIMEGAFISEADYEKLITEVVGKRAKREHCICLNRWTGVKESLGKAHTGRISGLLCGCSDRLCQELSLS